MKLYQEFDKNKLFFTSDTHFYHKNIIEYCNRPFLNQYEMCNAIRDNWNKKVPEDGIVFHLGDVSLTANPKALENFLYSLNGTIHLIIGNHENDALSKEYIRKRWASIHDILEIFVLDDESSNKIQHIVMCHYPMLVWNCSHKTSWQLFGHVHGGLSNKGKLNHKPTQLDVGVDSHNFTPLSYQEVKEIIESQTCKK